MLYPLTFQPIFKERVWGGRNLERLFGKSLPAGQVIGESWEITDRPEGVSVIANGPFAGKNLRWLMDHAGDELLGPAKRAADGRFPLLVKLLDAQDKLSLQVHPPAHKAAALGGEAKTEMWYVADATPAADIFVGLKRGVTAADFERKIQDGTVAECFHRHEVHRGDAMFLPSGRVHALGAGSVIFEIQQNSDTTYRVFDWNRMGLDGQPRELHISQAMASIDFTDFEPSLVQPKISSANGFQWSELAACELFRVTKFETQSPLGARVTLPRSVAVVAALTGRLAISSWDGRAEPVMLEPGKFCLVPGDLSDVELATIGPASGLLANPL